MRIESKMGVGLALGLALCVGAATRELWAQEGVRRPPQDERRLEQEPLPTWPFAENQARSGESLLADMQGAWVLTELVSAELQNLNRDEVGYLLVAGHFLSIEIHASFHEPGYQETRRTGQSGTHRLRMTEDGNLITEALIGTYFVGNGVVVFERPGTERSYRVQAGEYEIVLTRQDGQRLTFRRMRAEEQESVDIFGRDLPEEDLPPEGDPWGRERR